MPDGLAVAFGAATVLNEKQQERMTLLVQALLGSVNNSTATGLAITLSFTLWPRQSLLQTVHGPKEKVIRNPMLF